MLTDKIQASIDDTYLSEKSVSGDVKNRETLWSRGLISVRGLGPGQ